MNAIGNNMTWNKFEDILDEVPYGYEKYLVLVNSLEYILDNTSELLSEEDYIEFKQILKDRIMEDL